MLTAALLAVCLASDPTSIELRLSSDDPETVRVAEAIETALEPESVSTEPADAAPALASVDVRYDGEAITVVIDDLSSEDTLRRQIPSADGVSAVAAEESAYVVREAIVSLRDRGALVSEPPADVEDDPPAPTPPAPEPEPTPPPPTSTPSEEPEPPTPTPDRAFPRGIRFETSIGPGVYLPHRGSALPTLAGFASVGFEYGRTRTRDDLRVLVTFTLGRDERFNVPASWRGGARGPLGAASQWDFMPRVKVGRVFGRTMPFVAVGAGPGLLTDNETEEDRFIVSMLASAGVAWQLPYHFQVGLDVGVVGTIDPLRPTNRYARPYAALLISHDFGLGRRDD